MVQMEAVEVHAARCHLQKERYLKHHYLTHSAPVVRTASPGAPDLVVRGTVLILLYNTRKIM